MNEIIIFFSSILPILAVFVIPITLSMIHNIPDNTAIIIDRNTHYLKTVRRGPFIMLPKDKITTRISTNPLKEWFVDLYELEDGNIIRIDVSCEYRARNIEDVLYALKSVRRSIEDIVKSSAYFAARALKTIDLKRDENLLHHVIETNLTKELDSVNIDLISVRTLCGIIWNVDINEDTKVFKPHVSRTSSNGVITTDDNDPIQYK